MKHRHLSLQERYYIEIELKKGSSQNAIAKALNRQQGWDLQFKLSLIFLYYPIFVPPFSTYYTLDKKK